MLTRVWFGLVRLLITEGEGCMRGLLMLCVISLVFSRATVNDDGLGGTALDLCVWSVGPLPKRRTVRESVRNHAMLLGVGNGVVFRWR